MDIWVEAVRDLKDIEKAEGTEPFEVETTCRDILRYIRTARIRDIGRFSQRTGLEYEKFMSTFHNKGLVQRIIMDDEFWDATIKVRK